RTTTTSLRWMELLLKKLLSKDPPTRQAACKALSKSERCGQAEKEGNDESLMFPQKNPTKTFSKIFSKIFV
ncbi:MAG: hypothetical protein VXW00_16200, partial [Candidatus Latescibacterota bacterium]|nr:hypothetical protein [Candidatus Latescibacterota bacterium]